jgi:hypothetical protein
LTEDETRAVSDHYPIYAEFYCEGDTDTPEKGGSLSVNSSPLGATIYLDGLYKGKTPRTITEVPPDDHTIKLTLEGYYDWSTSVNAKAGETSYLHAILTPIPTTGPITPTPTPTATLFEKIEGLTAISVGGAGWDNWDADMENDGPVIFIAYLDARGDIITDDSTTKMPISADVKLYARDSDSIWCPYDKLVFSAHYTEDEIILSSIFHTIHIPKEEISVNPSTDYWLGAVEVTIYTPSQGSFADRNYISLYEE